MKVDIQKAFDTVDWSFLREVLIGLGFPMIFVAWIMECVSTASYSISINGGLHGFFTGRRGLRQGDPLSPFLFATCIEFLPRLVKRDTTSSDLNYHPLCARSGITHLAYADDL